MLATDAMCTFLFDIEIFCDHTHARVIVLGYFDAKVSHLRCCHVNSGVEPAWVTEFKGNRNENTGVIDVQRNNYDTFLYY